MAKKMNELICCAKCNAEMKIVIIPRYEYEEGFILHNVSVFKCAKCGKVFFTEEQALALEARTSELKEYTFSFERKVTISGTSLVVGIPSELADYLKIKQGQKVKIQPISKEGFMIRISS